MTAKCSEEKDSKGTMTSGYFSRYGWCVLTTSAQNEVACAKAAGICQQVINRLISRLILISIFAVILPLWNAAFY